MNTTPEFTEAQLLSARAEAWHQAGEPLLTLEAARAWVNGYGLVLFAPQAQTLGAPAPSLVEATLGAATAAPTAAQNETALGLLARMVAEGSAVPLNLLGGPGDVPDFVASAPVFSFCYTMRGDKAWKQPPAQTGAVKVSPLALRVFETLTERGSLTAEALVSELGREVTHSAVLRALGELWAQLRVLPRREGQSTAWELSTQRFMKAIKAGSNAGLPKALSALVSLYLHQAISASEAEIEAFLSPLTARSRIREVVHALTAARELETVVLGGKTMLFVADTLPEFAPVEPEVSGETGLANTGIEGEPGAWMPPPVREYRRSEGEGRISRFKGAGPRGGDLRGKPFRTTPERKAPGGAFGRRDNARPAAGERRGGFDRPARAGERSAARPSTRGDRPSTFTRPWEEERRERTGSPSEGDRPARPFRPRGEGEGARPFRPRSQGEDRSAGRPLGRSGAPSRSGASSRSGAPARPGGPARSGTGRAGDRPFRRSGESEARREFRPGASGERSGPFRRDRSEGNDRGAAAPRRGPRFSPGEDRERGPRSERPSRPERGAFTRPQGERSDGSGERRAFSRREGERSSGPSGGGERRSFRPRTEERGDRASSRPPRTERSAGPARPRFDRKRPNAGAPKRSFEERPRRERPAGREEGAERPSNRGPKRFGPTGTRPEWKANRTSFSPRPAGARPQGARAGGRNEGFRPGRPSSAGASRGPRPGAKGPGRPKAGGPGFGRAPRPLRRPDEPAGEP